MVTFENGENYSIPFQISNKGPTFDSKWKKVFTQHLTSLVGKNITGLAKKAQYENIKNY